MPAHISNMFLSWSKPEMQNSREGGELEESHGQTMGSSSSSKEIDWLAAWAHFNIWKWPGASAINQQPALSFSQFCHIFPIPFPSLFSASFMEKTVFSSVSAVNWSSLSGISNICSIVVGLLCLMSALHTLCRIWHMLSYAQNAIIEKSSYLFKGSVLSKVKFHFFNRSWKVKGNLAYEKNGVDLQKD